MPSPFATGRTIPEAEAILSGRWDPEGRGVSLENPSTPLSNPAAWLYTALGAIPSAAGPVVSERTALACSVIYACVKVLAEAIGYLPLHLLERVDGGKRRAPAHPLYTLLHDEPNEQMTALVFRESLQANAALHGNGYAEIEWGEDGYPRALWPLPAPRVTPERRNGRKIYWVETDGQRLALADHQVLHVPALGFDGIRGYSPLQLMRNSAGLAIAAEEYGGKLFSQGVKPSGALQHPGRLTPQARANLRESVETMHSGLANAHRFILLEEGMQWHQMSLSPDDAQFLETRQFQIPELCRWFRVPPHMVMDLSKASYNSLEQLGLEFVTHTLGRWLVAWEQEIHRKLLVTPEEKARYFAEFNVLGYLRGDHTARANFYRAMREIGVMNADEIRDREGLNPLPDGAGQVYYVPANMTTPANIAAGTNLANRPAAAAGESTK